MKILPITNMNDFLKILEKLPFDTEVIKVLTLICIVVSLTFIVVSYLKHQQLANKDSEIALSEKINKSLNEEIACLKEKLAEKNKALDDIIKFSDEYKKKSPAKVVFCLSSDLQNDIQVMVRVLGQFGEKIPNYSTIHMDTSDDTIFLNEARRESMESICIIIIGEEINDNFSHKIKIFYNHIFSSQMKCYLIYFDSKRSIDTRDNFIDTLCKMQKLSNSGNIFMVKDTLGLSFALEDIAVLISS